MKKRKGGNPKPRGKKGSKFERDICKQLSLWWTDQERNDVFWRTSQSGGRATFRSKSGRGTKNQYGDIQATDSIGQPLIDLCTIEIKKGYGNKSYFDLLDKLPNETKQPYVKFIMQAEQQQKEAGTFAWILITKRDRKETLIAMPVKLKRLLMQVDGEPDGCYPQMTIRFFLPDNPHRDRVKKIFITTLSEFMFNVDPKCFKRAIKKEFE